MPGAASDIPVGTQFSPNVIDLRDFLLAAEKYAGNREALKKAVGDHPVRLKDPGKERTRRTASLPLEAAVDYGLLEPGSWRLTAKGKELAGLQGLDLYERFAHHILTAKRGLEVVEGTRAWLAEARLNGEPINADRLSAFLRSQGLNVIEHNTAINTMRLWLAKAGLYPEKGAGVWDINEERLVEILGAAPDEIAAIASWSPEHRALARALCRLDPKGPEKTARIREEAEKELGYSLSRASSPILFAPLIEAGYVQVDSGKGQQTGKSATVTLTPRFRKDVLQPFLEHAEEQMGSAVFQLYGWTADRIRSGLQSEDVHEKGQALEAYAIRIMRILGLGFVAWRQRATADAAEVDVVLSGLIGGIPTRWQLQCKNTKGDARLNDVAREVGVALVTKATHILIFSNHGFTRPAIKYARDVMQQTAFTVFLVGGDDFKRVLEEGGTTLLQILRKQGDAILKIHREGVGESE